MIPIPMLLDIGSKILDKVLPDPEAKAQAQLKLLEMQQQGELAQIQSDTVAMQETTKRWEADTKTDSWLAKNIRPLTLIFILLSYSVFSLMSAAGVHVTEAYVKLLGEWGQLVMLAYFGGRSVEKIMEMRNKK